MSRVKELIRKVDYCSLNCGISFSENSRKLTLVCPFNQEEPKMCFSIFAFWSMHFKKLHQMVIRSPQKTRVLSQKSTDWIKEYSKAIRKILDWIYIKSFSDSFSVESVQDLCQVYHELGEIYDGSIILDRERSWSLWIDRIIQHLPSMRKESLRCFVKRNLSRALRGTILEGTREIAFKYRSVANNIVLNELDAYRVGPLSIRIVESIKSTNPIYLVSFVDHRTARLIFELSHLLQLRSRFEGKYLHSFRELIDWRRHCAKDQISLLCTDQLPNDLRWGVYSHAAYSSVGLRKYYALLVDDRVNEFYLDAPNYKAYLDHENWNRCLTNIRFNKEDVEHFITHLRRETNQRLDYSIPSIKADLSCTDFNIRASIDAFPLTKDGTAIDVRKYRRLPMTILDLISNGTLNIEAAAFILFSYIFRRSISVVGEPSSGKTTLVNAIDLCAPSWWRKVTIEDVVESVSQLKYGRHQIRIQVEPLEQGPSSRLKSVETTRLLHRNPTYVLLGEIQTAEHSKALFQALASGLRVIHTVHASSPEGLIRRFLLQHNISKEDLKSLELMIFIKNFMGFQGLWRKVIRISELVFENDDQLIVNDIFRYNFESNELLLSQDLYQSNTVRRILEEYPLKKEDIGQILSLYKKFLESLVIDCKRLTHENVVKKFDSFNLIIAKKFHLYEIKRTSTQEATIQHSGGAS